MRADMQYLFVNVRKNYPAWRFSDERGVYRYDPIFEISSGSDLVYMARNMQPERIRRLR